MGGNIQGFGNVTEAAEFNFHADPEAAYTVLRLTRCPTTIAPWELSYKYNKVDFGWRNEVLGKLTTPAAKLINACEEVIAGDNPNDNVFLILFSGLVPQLALGRQLDPLRPAGNGSSAQYQECRQEQPACGHCGVERGVYQGYDGAGPES